MAEPESLLVVKVYYFVKFEFIFLSPIGLQVFG